MRIVVMLLVLLTAQLAFAGRPDSYKSQEVLDALGLQAKQPLGAKVGPGALVPAVVVDPTKMAAHGFMGVQRGDEVMIKIAPERKFSVEVKKHSLSKNLSLNQKGQIVQ